MEIKGFDSNLNVWDIPGFSSMSEFPFLRDDMTWGEYWKEREYFAAHYQDYRIGTYVPLWKQKW